MHPLDWLVALGLAALLPIPLYWFVIHPLAGFWRRLHPALAFWTAVPVSTLIAWPLLCALRQRLFAASLSPWWAKSAGLLLMALALYIFGRVKKEMGSARLLGKTEMAGGGELQVAGLYRHVRHPSYAAQMAAMLGICLIAGTVTTWLVAAGWVLLLNLAIQLEERELLARFGDSYRTYRDRVPAFLPLRLWRRE